MKTQSFVYSIILGLIILVVGVEIGIFYQSQKFIFSAQSNPNSGLAASLKSKAVTSIYIEGTVNSISGKNISLSYLGDSLTLAISNNAKVVTMVKGKSQKGSFSDIKKGDDIIITADVNSSNVLEGNLVVIE